MNMARTIPPMAAPGLFGPAERVFGAESPTESPAGSRAESATGDRAAPIHLQVTTLPRAGEGGMAFLNRLLSGPVPEEALCFAAHALDQRHAVWWGHECLLARVDRLDAVDRRLLAFAAEWVRRRDAASAAEALAEARANPGGAGHWIALAAGSPPALAAGRVATGVLLFLTRLERAERRRWLGEFAAMARSLGG